MSFQAQDAVTGKVTSDPRSMLIHVGLPKTGTTSLQVGLKSAGEVNYIHDPELNQPQSRHFANAVGIGQDLLNKSERDTWRDAFLTGLEGKGLPVVVSDETLSQVSRLDFDVLEDMLRRIAGETRILLVVRPFFSWVESLLNQFAKKGRPIIFEFDLDHDEHLNGYDINFETIYASYARLAERLGERCEILAMRYAPSVTREICAIAGVDPSCLDAVPPLNRSPKASEAMLAYLKAQNINADPFKASFEGMHFLGYEEIERLHAKHGAWMQRLAQRLGWPLDAIDDSAAFRQKTEAGSLLRIGRGLS